MSTAASARFPAFPLPRPVPFRGEAPPGQETRRWPLRPPWLTLGVWLRKGLGALRRLAGSLGLVRAVGADQRRPSLRKDFKLLGGLGFGLALGLVLLPPALALGLVLRLVPRWIRPAGWGRPESGPERARS